ncbi:MAG: CarD-like/TRCF domain protein [Lachnospiraceae bacterium]
MSEEIKNVSFNKKDIIFSENLGVCRVDELTNLSQQNGETIAYYGLRSVFDKSKVSYIPVQNHSVQLRPLITVEEAGRIKEQGYDEAGLLVQQEVDYVLKQENAQDRQK